MVNVNVKKQQLDKQRGRRKLKTKDGAPFWESQLDETIGIKEGKKCEMQFLREGERWYQMMVVVGGVISKEKKNRNKQEINYRIT